jgi:hypothetical protein
MKHIKLYENFLNEDGYGRDYFIKEKEGKVYRYFFKIEGEEKDLTSLTSEEKIYLRENMIKFRSQSEKKTIGGNNNSTKLKKKYTYKYMANKRHRKRRSRKQRGGVFGASQWAPALIGNNVAEQESALQNGEITQNSTILDNMNKFQGGSKGGNITNVLAQGAVPATLFAANYMYSPGRKSRKRKSRKRKASRKFRLF